jgi:hypothetical protein
MEGCDILIEVDCEEVEIANTRLFAVGATAMLLLEVIRCVGRYGSDLLITASISRYEENRNAVELHATLAFEVDTPYRGNIFAYCFLVINPLLTVKIQRIFRGKASVFGIELGEWYI